MTDQPTYNYATLREHLRGYYEKGLLNGFSCAKVDIARVDAADDEELLQIADEEDFNLDEYLLDRPEEVKEDKK